MTLTILNTFDTWINAQGLKSQGRNRSLDNISLEGIARLRELILELAVRGKLTEDFRKSNPELVSGSNSAQALLEQIATEKEQMVKEGKLKKLEKLSLISENEKPFELPDGWVFTRLHFVSLEQNQGINTTTENITYSKNGFSVIQAGNISTGKIQIGFEKFVDIETFNRINEKFKPKKNDILYSNIGANFGIAAIVDVVSEFIISWNVLRIRTSKNINLNFFRYWLNSPYVRSFAWNQVGTSTVPFISGKKIEQYIIPLPPLAEQHRIVEKVDELMALCDTLEEKQTYNLHTHQLLVETLLETLTQAKTTEELQAAWQRLATCFDTLFTTEESVNKLKQTILQLAVMGKLTRAFRERHPELVSKSNSAQALLEQIAAEKERLVTEGKLKRQEKLPPISEAEKPFKLPEGWKWERWANLANWITYGFTRPMSHVEKGIPIITGKNVIGEKIDFATADYTSTEEYNLLNEKDKPQKGDILVTKDGTIGRSAIVEDETVFCINQSVAILWVKDKPLNKKFLLNVIISPYTQSIFLTKASGVAIKHISVTHFGQMLCPLPPLAEQHRIVEKVDELFALCDALNARIANTRKIENQLASAVVEAAVG